ncbi:uncharacterized protein G2W53_012893 [Senna tora]|uniref:Uncharacterized protein n=1 Tax=Senna tora TaxID=362788 RepID=A0A834U1V2_9FABA|nr:uncharacterized protein G2W53_012893 [Senna tora]
MRRLWNEHNETADPREGYEAEASTTDDGSAPCLFQLKPLAHSCQSLTANRPERVAVHQHNRGRCPPEMLRSHTLVEARSSRAS